jgi:hypothetical protein
MNDASVVTFIRSSVKFTDGSGRSWTKWNVESGENTGRSEIGLAQQRVQCSMNRFY